MAFGRIVIGISMAAIALCVGLVLFLLLGATFALSFGVSLIVLLVMANIHLRIMAANDHRELVNNQNNMAEAVGHCMRQTTALTQRLDDLHMDISEHNSSEMASIRAEVDLVAQAVRELADVMETETSERKNLSHQIQSVERAARQEPVVNWQPAPVAPPPAPLEDQPMPTPAPQPATQTARADLGSFVPDRGHAPVSDPETVYEAPLIEATRRQFVSEPDSSGPAQSSQDNAGPPAGQIVASVAPEPVAPEPTAPAPALAEPEITAPSAPNLGAQTLFSEALDDGRAEIFLQPIVNLPQRKVQAYEAITRMRTLTAGFIDPDIYRPSIADHATLVGVDRLSLSRSLQIGARLNARGRDVKIFTPLSLRALSDGAFLNSAIRMLAGAAGSARSLIFQLIQSDVAKIGPVEDAALAALSDTGAEFAVANVEAFDFDMRQLSKKRFRHAFVAADLLVGGRAVSADIHAADLSGLLLRHGMRMITTGVATERTVVDLLDFDVPLAQGDLFSTPRPVRADILGEQSATGSSARATG